MRRDREPVSMWRSLGNLTAALGIGLFVWNVGAPDSWKDAVHAWGDDFVTAGQAAGNLQKTSWRWNIGLDRDPANKWANRDGDFFRRLKAAEDRARDEELQRAAIRANCGDRVQP